jgi:hypothetical protein
MLDLCMNTGDGDPRCYILIWMKRNGHTIRTFSHRDWAGNSKSHEGEESDDRELHDCYVMISEEDLKKDGVGSD